MKFTKAERWGIQIKNACERYGLMPDGYRKLCSLSAQLGKWGEEECNGTIRRDDGKMPHRWEEYKPGHWRDLGEIVDKEKIALIKARKIVESVPGLGLYYQTDPRGVALYLYNLEDLKATERIDCVYSSIGHACYRED